MEDTELLQIALRVLDGYAINNTPTPEDLKALRNAAPDHANRCIDELARYIIHRELNRLDAHHRNRSKGAGG
jgi:hypothetical protein